MSKWVDLTETPKDDAHQVEQILKYRVSNGPIVTIRKQLNYPHTWVVSANEVGLKDTDLRVTDKRRAKVEALHEVSNFVENRVREFSGILKALEADGIL